MDSYLLKKINKTSIVNLLVCKSFYITDDIAKSFAKSLNQVEPLTFRRDQRDPTNSLGIKIKIERKDSKEKTGAT